MGCNEIDVSLDDRKFKAKYLHSLNQRNLENMLSAWIRLTQRYIYCFIHTAGNLVCRLIDYIGISFRARYIKIRKYSMNICTYFLSILSASKNSNYRNLLNIWSTKLWIAQIQIRNWITRIMIHRNYSNRQNFTVFHNSARIFRTFIWLWNCFLFISAYSWFFGVNKKLHAP